MNTINKPSKNATLLLNNSLRKKRHLNLVNCERDREIKRLEQILRGAKSRCGKPPHYAHVRFDFPNVKIAAEQLYEKVGPIPPGMSLDRIDPRGPYSPGNIKYSTPREQALNTRHAARFWE